MKIGPIILTRDSAWWGVSAVLSFAAVLATLTDPSGPMSLAYYGIPPSWLPYIRLLGLANAWWSGKMSNSPAASSSEVARGIRDNGRPIALLLALGLAASMLSGCASLASARHRSALTIGSTHAVLTTLREGELLLVCGKSTAPAPPNCVTVEQHRAFSAKLVTAFDLDGKVAQLARDLPADASPSSYAGLLGQIGRLVDDALALIPDSTGKASLLSKAGVR